MIRKREERFTFFVLTFLSLFLYTITYHSFNLNCYYCCRVKRKKEKKREKVEKYGILFSVAKMFKNGLLFSIEFKLHEIFL